MTPFVLAAGQNETLIVNRLCFGVGCVYLARGAYNPVERDMGCRILTKRREEYGDGVFVCECGANLGTHTIGWAKHMMGWGNILAIEPQERTFYALAGNIALNNCFNAWATLAAVGKESGTIGIPVLNYQQPGHFSGLELRKREGANGVGQVVDYENTTPVQLVTVDEFNFPRLDFLKIDVEGMDPEVLIGAEQTILKYRPVIYIEVIYHKDEICSWLEAHDYILKELGTDVLATHKSDISYDV